MTTLDRRNFLRVAGLTAAAEFAGSLPLPPAAPHGDDWLAVRAMFTLNPEYAHFATFFLASHPKPVRDAIEKYRRMLDADPFQTVEHGCFGKPEENLGLRTKRAAATYLGGKPEEIALVQSTTMGLALVYAGLRLQPGEEVLTTLHDHYSHHESIRLAAVRSGASVRKLALYDRLEDLPALTVDAIVARITQAIRPATRVLGLTWVHSASGLKLPLREIAAAVRKLDHRVLIVVDGVHGLGVEDETPATTGIDVFVAGTHKWMFGPRGTGLVWADAATWGPLVPLIPTFDSDDLYEAWTKDEAPRGPAKAAWFTPGGFHAFEHEWAIADAFALHQQLGKKNVAQRVHELNRKLKDGLAEMPHVKLYTPRGDDLSAGLTGFDIAGRKPAEVVAALHAKKIIASESPYGRSVARLSAGLMNTEAEVETALRAVRALG